MDVDDLFIKSFLKDVNEKERKKVSLSQEDRETAKQKREKLEYIYKFLQKFVDLEVYVNHYDFYTKNTRTMEGVVPQLFHFYEVDSSPSWAPGISIWIDHPATIEIAIPNRIEEGVVVIKVASHHPDAFLLEQKFSTYEAACIALGTFLSKCTTSIGKDPTKYMKDIEQKKETNIKETSQPSGNYNYITDKSNKLSDSTNRSYPINETPVLKDSQSPTTLKKIGEFFHVNKTNLSDDDED